MLSEIVERTRERIEFEKSVITLDELKVQVSYLNTCYDYPFKKALMNEGMSIIAEVKKASPSKGLIADDFNPVLIAKEYELGGADAISVLTEPYFFRGDDDYLKDIASNVNVPVLRKDFIVDEYMIYQSKLLGASAVLLIAAVLDIVALKKYLDLAHQLGLSAIVEVHDADEMRKALNVGAEIIGVNNRDLTNFTVNIENSIDLRRCAGHDIIFISESGIKTKEDIIKLKENDVDAVLIGETLMRSDDKSAKIQELKNE